MKFAERLEEKRRELGISKRRMAELLGIHPAQYSVYINGKRQPNKANIQRFAERLNVSEELLNCNDEFKQTAGFHTYAALISALLNLLASDSIGGFTMDEVCSMDGRAGIHLSSYDPNLSNFFQCYETFKALLDTGNITDRAFENMFDSLVKALDRKEEAR